MSKHNQPWSKQKEAEMPPPEDELAAFDGPPTEIPAEQDPWWLKKAFKEMGQKEIKGEKANPRILEYHKMTSLGAGSDEVPWCAAFICWVMGEKGSAAARSFLSFGKPCDFKRGAVAVFDSDRSVMAGHVALALDEEFDHQRGEVLISVLGGNQGDMVKISKFPKRRLLGYRWPPSQIVNKAPAKQA